MTLLVLTCVVVTVLAARLAFWAGGVWERSTLSGLIRRALFLNGTFTGLTERQVVTLILRWIDNPTERPDDV